VSSRQGFIFIWVDETGLDKRDQIRKFGCALKGQTASSLLLLFRDQRINVIATEMTKSTVDGSTFFEFLQGTFIPNRSLSQLKICAYLDNYCIHHIAEVKDLLTQSGIVTPYNPAVQILTH